MVTSETRQVLRRLLQDPLRPNIPTPPTGTAALVGWRIPGRCTGECLHPTPTPTRVPVRPATLLSVGKGVVTSGSIVALM